MVVLERCRRRRSRPRVGFVKAAWCDFLVVGWLAKLGRVGIVCLGSSSWVGDAVSS